jgi:hypothetical protein
LCLVRDEFEAKLPKWQTALATYTGLDCQFEIEADILQLYAYATEDWQKQGFGGCLGHYASSFVEAAHKYTKEGEDHEAQECLRRIIPKNRVRIAADSSQQISYCGLSLDDGILYILFHPEKFGSNVYDLGSEARLAVFVDSRESRSYTNLLKLIFVYSNYPCGSRIRPSHLKTSST